VSGGTIIAPGAPVLRSPGRRGFDIVQDLVLAVFVVLALPLTLAIAMALIEAAVTWLTR